MGVYVKGMEMPHDCGDCDFLSGLICPDNAYHCYAPVDNKNHSINVTVFVENRLKPLWCPLVEVPTPHGSLVDRKAYWDETDKHEWFCRDDELARAFDILEELPEVLPGEGE